LEDPIFGTVWKMPEIILISPGCSDWPPGILVQLDLGILVQLVPHVKLIDGLRQVINLKKLTKKTLKILLFQLFTRQNQLK
jgi:hypothetical protein